MNKSLENVFERKKYKPAVTLKVSDWVNNALPVALETPVHKYLPLSDRSTLFRMRRPD